MITRIGHGRLPKFELPVCPGIEPRHRLPVQVEVNERVCWIPHVKMEANLPQFTKIRPQFWSALDAVSHCDTGTPLICQCGNFSAPLIPTFATERAAI